MWSGLDAVFSQRWWFLCMKQVMWINNQLKVSYIESEVSENLGPFCDSFPARCMCSSCLFKGRGVFKDPLTTKGKMSLFLFHSGTGRRVWKLYRASKTSDKSHLLQQVFSRASLGYKLLSFSMLFNNLAILLTGEAGYWRFLSSEAKLKCRGKWADPVQWIKC